MKGAYFITSCGTDIGKTFVTCRLAAQANAAGALVQALKPVISGYGGIKDSNDTTQILTALGLPILESGADLISPWRLREPLAPSMAAEAEGRRIYANEVVEYCLQRRAESDGLMLVEGAGGVMVPLNERETMLDVMERLKFRVILVVSNYLGAISHTLTALEALKSRRISPYWLIINESAAANNPVDMDKMAEVLIGFSTCPITLIKRVENCSDLSTPDLTHIVSQQV